MSKAAVVDKKVKEIVKKDGAARAKKETPSGNMWRLRVAMAIDR